MKKILVIFLTILTSLSWAQEANYFRAWQGFKNPKLGYEAFLKVLPPFMDETVQLYADHALVNYIVVVPPVNKPSFVPDELALVSLTSIDDYQRIRSTPEGQRYSARHWDVFNKSNSKSADPITDFQAELPKTLSHNQSYDVIGRPINWQKGFNTVYVGVRKKYLSTQDFLKKLRNHIEMVARTMSTKGLNGYVVIANNDYEVAFMNWDSKNAHDNAYKTSGGAATVKDGALILELLMYEEAKGYRTQFKNDIKPGKAYSTMPMSSKYYDTYDPNGDIDSH